MNLPEAIEISENEQRRNYIERGNPVYEAHQLGIEALKRCQFLSKDTTPFTWTPLPGETADERKA